MATICAPSVVILPMAQPAAPEIELDSILYIHTTPYLADGWRHALRALDISHIFPLLVTDIIHGSLISKPPPLQHTFIPKNLPSALSLPHIVDDEIAAEVSAKRMSSPFSISEATTIFNGHFRTSPLGLVDKEPGSGKWRTIRHFSKEDAAGNSTNSWLNADDFPTKYYLASTTADYVHPSIDLVHLTYA